jgi:hypothetical protein
VVGELGRPGAGRDASQEQDQMSTGKREAGRLRRAQPGGDPEYTPGASGRRAVEQRVAAPLLFAAQLPRWLPPLVMVALLVTGLAVRGVIGAVALCAVAAVLGLLGFVSWPRLTVRGRLGRAVVIGAVLAAAAWQATR